jgi:predicted GIY-YIG superfamily endonuclease
VKGRFGIYALYRRDKLYYVGLASNLRNRLKSHLRDKHAERWDRFSLYLTSTNEYLRELEALALRIATPKGNRSKTRFSHAKNLREILKKKIEESQEAELAALFEYVPKPRGKRGRHTRSRSDTRRIRLSDLIDGRVPIRMTHRGRTYSAVVRKSGTILFRGKTYGSPSAAARLITRRHANGWYHWKYEVAPGEWVRLRELRK